MRLETWLLVCRLRPLWSGAVICGIALAMGIGLGSSSYAAEAETELTDIYGTRHYLKDFVGDQAKAFVVVVLDDKCPVVQQEIPALIKLYEKYNGFQKDRAGRPTEFAKYPGERVGFLGVYVKHDMGSKAMAAHAAATRLPFRVVHDEQHGLIEKLGLTRLSEVVLLDRQQNVLYRGPVDDQYVQGAAKPAATKHYLVDALEATLAGKPVEVASRPSVGCKITPPPARDEAAASLTYHRDIAAIVQKRCQSCHREGEVAPMPFESYDDVLAYANMVEEVVLNERMPPYPGETSRAFASDERLSADERRTLLDWLRSGRKEGDPADAPQPIAWIKRGEWAVGQPDFVFKMPKPFPVPANGVLNYVYIPVPVNGGKGFPEDRWISAVETHPGARQVVHHVQIHEYFGPIDHEPKPLDQILIYGLGIETARLIGSYTPGNEEGNKLVLNRYLSESDKAAGKTAGVKLSKGANLMFEVHYTTNGTAMDDQSEVGIQFSERKPDMLLETWFPFRSRADMIVPANVGHHTLQDLYHFGRATNGKPVLLHGIRPHMHSRGKSFRVELVNAKGMSLDAVRDFSQHELVRGEPILTVPVWDFSWQRFYQFKEPILIRPDQALLATAYWDNTEFNPRNPDPNVDVPWGQQTIQEMFNTLLLYEVLEPDDPRANPVAPPVIAENAR
jgi:mono/diheme cytochrome c family protein